MKNEIVALALDLHKGSLGKYSKEDAEQKLREAFIKIAGNEEGKVDYRTFRKNKIEIFEILEEVLDIQIKEGIENQFQEFTEIKDLAWGDTNEFQIPNKDLFQISVVADGTGNIRRQRTKDYTTLSLPVKTYAVKIYEDFHRFLAGRINWSEMISRIAKSFEVKLKNDIYNLIYNAYNTLSAPYQYSGSLTVDSLLDMALHVEAKSGQDVIIMGTKKALSKVTPAQVSDNMKDKFNNTGYYGVVSGVEMFEVKQSHAIGTDTFVINDNFFLIVPKDSDKFVKLVNEGHALIREYDENKSADMTMEYEFIKKFGLGILAGTSTFGLYRFS
jgi:hypothetical protein